jgi:hypothetical protein
MSTSRVLLGVLCLCLAHARSQSTANPASFTSSNLPIVVINTHGQLIVDEPKITADMGIIFNGEGQRNNITDPFNHYDGKIGIEIRGSSTQMFPKKQYAVETRDSLGEDSDVPLLGLPAESDWILSAPYNDKSLIRDALTYTLARSLERYASRSHFCEVVINGDYRGVYLLLEKIKRGKNRVNISKIDTSSITGDNLTGGYIVKIDKLEGAETAGWYSAFLPSQNTSKKILYQYHYPNAEDIVVQQKTFIQNLIQTFETKMSNSDYADTSSGYSKYLDVASATDFFLVNELSKNVDACRLSTFMVKDKDSKGGKLTMGPVWDFNHGFGNCNYYDASVIQGWQLTYLTTNASFIATDGALVPFWWKRLYQDTIFMQKVTARWIELRKNQFSLEVINGYIDSLVGHLDESQQRNFEKWPVLNTYIWPNVYVGGTYANEISYLKDWIKKRLDWMDLALAGISLTAVEMNAQQPKTFTLYQNYPNPFNPTTTINFSLSPNPSPAGRGEGVRLLLKVYDFLGREIVTLVNEKLRPGSYSVEWDATKFPSGAYCYRLKAGSYVETKKMVLLR